MSTPAAQINALNCTSATFCVAVDGSGYAVIYGTSGWNSPSDVDGANALKAISCAEPRPSATPPTRRAMRSATTDRRGRVL